jgi:hypothetical protein
MNIVYTRDLIKQDSELFEYVPTVDQNTDLIKKLIW